MLLELHQDLLKRLSPIAQMPGAALQLRLLPESPAAYLNSQAQPQVICWLPESRFEKPEGGGTYSQEWLMRFSVEIRLPSYWGTTGMLTVLMLALRLLIGYKPATTARKIYIDRTALKGQFDDCWVQEIYFIVPARLVEPGPDNDIGPLLEQIKLLRPDASEWGSVTDPTPETVAAPTGLSAVLEGSTIAILWLKPAPTPPYTLIGYAVQLQVGGVWGSTRNLNTETLTIAGLDPLPTAARVRAMWSCGYSDWVSAALP